MSLFSWIRNFLNKKKEPIEKRRTISDSDYNMNKKKDQDETDKILDKISLSGYDSLTEQERQFLTKISKN